MRDHILRRDDALVDEILDFRMILGRADQLALAQQVETRIAYVRPVRVPALNDDRNARRPRRLEHRELIRVRAERRMRAQQRFLHELQRIQQDWLGFLLEPLDEEPHGNLRGDVAADMPAHSVGDDEQQRLAAVRVRRAVLIDFARTLARLLEDRETHDAREPLQNYGDRAARPNADGCETGDVGRSRAYEPRRPAKQTTRWAAARRDGSCSGGMLWREPREGEPPFEIGRASCRE